MPKIRLSFVLILTILTVLPLTNCANKDVPKWFIEPPNSRYITATATANDSHTAMNVAMKQATVEAVRQIEARIEAMLERFSQESATDISTESDEIAKAVATEVVAASYVTEKKVIKVDKHHRAYVLVEILLDAENTILVQQISQRKELYPSLRISQNYRELEQIELLKLLDWAVEETFVNAEGFGIARVYPNHALANSFNVDLQNNMYSRWSQLPEFNYTFHLVTQRRPRDNLPHKYTPIWNERRYSGYEQQPLTEIETVLLKGVKAGKSLVYRKKDDILIGMGALRARKKCLECHKGGEGKLLGAFAYEVTTAELTEQPESN